MSEVNLAALAEADTNRIEAKAPTPMQEINVALKECKFGLFHLRLLFTALIGFVASVLVTNASAYLLPRAECDLNMDLVQKGFLIAVPYVGMLCSSILAGFLTDAFGRKKFLLVGYGGIFLCTLAAGSSQTYEVLVASKFFDGIFFAIAFSPTVTLTSEFLHNGIRDRVMLCQSSFAAMAQIVIALMSWGILTQEWRVSFWDGYFVLNTWNIYLYICSLWSLAAAILYAYLPESPKFLLAQKKYDAAREILINVYKENTRKAADTYPCGYLWKGKEKQYLDETPEIETKSGFKHQIVMGLHNAKPIFQKPLVMYLTLICCMIFLNMALYNVLRLWYPQLSTIIEHSSMSDVTSNTTDDLCQMLDKYTLELNQRKNMDAGDVSEVCVPKVSGPETYINSMIMGTVCLVPYLISSILVNKVGKKLLLFVSALVTCGGTLGLRFSSSKSAVVALFSMDTALTQTLISLLQTLIVEFFPTSVRTLTISIMMMCGRIGTLVGNVGFPILLNMGCVIPFYCMTGVMGLVTVMSLFLPSKKK